MPSALVTRLFLAVWLMAACESAAKARQLGSYSIQANRIFVAGIPPAQQRRCNWTSPILGHSREPPYMLAFHIIVPDTICCHRQGPQQVARWQSRASRWPTWKDHKIVG